MRELTKSVRGYVGESGYLICVSELMILKPECATARAGPGTLTGLSWLMLLYLSAACKALHFQVVEYVAVLPDQ